MMGSFQSLIEQMKQQPTQRNVCARSTQALELIKMKKSLKKTLRELSDDPDADEDDKLLVSKNLDTVIQQIKDELQS